MPLPDNGIPWPPAEHKLGLAHMAEWSAWYSGDPDELETYYQTQVSSSAPKSRAAQFRGGVVGGLARWWWGQPVPAGESRAKLHVPLAADICGTSSDLLFSEPVSITGDNKRLTEALGDLMENGLDTTLHEGGEVQAALGGVYLRVCWDADRQDMPWSNVVHADMALPEFRWGKLNAVTFWSKLRSHESAQVVWRLLERHESGVILHGLYAGDSQNLGQARPLEDHPDAEHLAGIVGESGEVLTGTNLLTATYIPNIRPNRRNRGSNLGRSDLQSVTPLLDALDEAYSSWWRDIRHAKSRIHMPAQYLQDMGMGQGAISEVDRELYVPLEGILDKGDRGLLIEAKQFLIRVAEHSQTCKEWKEAAIESAGYSTQSLSSGTGGAITAAEVHAHERRSYMTRGKKVRYWSVALREHLAALIEVANQNLGAGVQLGDIKVNFADGVQESAASVSQTALALKNAGAASTETLVRMVNPDWDDTQVATEVAAILAEMGGPAQPNPDDPGF